MYNITILQTDLCKLCRQDIIQIRNVTNNVSVLLPARLLSFGRIIYFHPIMPTLSYKTRTHRAHNNMLARANQNISRIYKTFCK